MFIDPARQRRYRFLVGALLLVCLFVLGYSIVGLASVILPSAPAAERSKPANSEDGAPPAVEDPAPTHRQPEQESQEPPAPAMTCDDMLVLVDRSHRLPPDYAPKDLISLPAYGVPTLGGREMLLRRGAAEQLKDMVVAATADGEELVVASAYRSYAQQQASHARLKSIYGSDADTMSATPGHSQHQLGTAVDFTNAAANYQVRRRFGLTSAYEWLQTHATGYGFVLAYPPGRDGTAYNFEPWHYRYIGVENARRLDQSDLTPQEFLVREGVEPDC